MPHDTPHPDIPGLIERLRDKTHTDLIEEFLVDAEGFELFDDSTIDTDEPAAALKAVVQKLDEAATALALATGPVTDAEIAAAIIAGCTAGDMHLACSFPECKCTRTVKVVRAALLAFQAGRVGK